MHIARGDRKRVHMLASNGHSLCNFVINCFSEFDISRGVPASLTVRRLAPRETATTDTTTVSIFLRSNSRCRAAGGSNICRCRNARLIEQRVFDGDATKIQAHIQGVSSSMGPILKNTRSYSGTLIIRTN